MNVGGGGGVCTKEALSRPRIWHHWTDGQSVSGASACVCAGARRKTMCPLGKESAILTMTTKDDNNENNNKKYEYLLLRSWYVYKKVKVL